MSEYINPISYDDRDVYQLFRYKDNEKTRSLAETETEDTQTILRLWDQYTTKDPDAIFEIRIIPIRAGYRLFDRHVEPDSLR